MSGLGYPAHLADGPSPGRQIWLSIWPNFGRRSPVAVTFSLGQRVPSTTAIRAWPQSTFVTQKYKNISKFPLKFIYLI